MGRDTVTVGLSPPSSAGQHGRWHHSYLGSIVGGGTSTILTSLMWVLIVLTKTGHMFNVHALNDMCIQAPHICCTYSVFCLQNIVVTIGFKKLKQAETVFNVVKINLSNFLQFFICTLSVVRCRAGAVRRVAKEQELGHNDDGDACPRPLPRPRPPRQQLRQGARPLGAGPVGKVPRVPSGCATVQEAEWGAQFQAERRGSGRVPGEI